MAICIKKSILKTQCITCFFYQLFRCIRSVFILNIATSEPDNLAHLLWERCNHIMDGKWLKQAPDHDIQVKMELLDVINHAKHVIDRVSYVFLRDFVHLGPLEVG